MLDLKRFKNVYLTSDTHFNHFNIIRYCSRPFSLEEAQKDISFERKQEITQQMNQAMIWNWNSVVSHEDLVIHLGDFSFGHPETIFNQLNGHIFLIRGNHDRQYYKWFKDKAKYLELKIGGFNVLLKHTPLKYSIEGDFIEVPWDLDPEKYDFCLCGHVHEKWLWHGINFNVGVDVHDFKPISLKYIDSQLSERK